MYKPKHLSKEDFEIFKDILQNDLKVLDEKCEQYGNNWKKRGGIGAFFNFVSKWDKVETRTKENLYNIFSACMDEDNEVDFNFLDELGDLRRYLMLVECEMLKISGGIEHYTKNST